MTNNGIKTQTVLEALEADNQDWAAKPKYARLTFARFVRACHQAEIADDRTIRQKWQILIDQDILLSPTKYSAVVDLEAFYDRLGIDYDPQGHADIQTHTKTLTQCSTGAQE